MTAIPPYILVVSSSTSELNNAQNKCLKDWRFSNKKGTTKRDSRNFSGNNEEDDDHGWMDDGLKKIKWMKKVDVCFFFVKRNFSPATSAGLNTME